jgi:SpoVK/Ycf46/Vps4 family AAA+-type ATPase
MEVNHYKRNPPSIPHSVGNQLTEAICPYENPHAHLVDELRWLNRILAIQVERLRCVNFYEDTKDFRSFFITDKEIDALLSVSVFESVERGKEKSQFQEIKQLSQLAQILREKINRRIQESLAQNIFLPIYQLKKLFNLNDFEIQTLIICLAPQIDSRYEKLYAYLQNNINKKLPSKDLIISLLVEDKEKHLESLTALNNSSPLIYYGLIEVTDSGTESSLIHSLLQIDPRIVQYLLGNNQVDQQLRNDLDFFQPIEWDQVVISESFQHHLQNLLNYELSQHGDVCIYFHGRRGVGKKTIARALCSELGLPLAVVDTRHLLKNPEIFETKLKKILREGLLYPCAVCFDRLENLEEIDQQLPEIVPILIRTLQELSWITFFCSKNPLPSRLLELTRIYPVAVSPPEFREQISLWNLQLNNLDLEYTPVDFAQITTRFNLTGGQIRHAVLRAEKTTHVRCPENPRITAEDLIVSSRIESQPQLSNLARKIEPKYSWEDLVLPEEQKSQLSEIANQVKHRHRVMDSWGFTRKISLGRGLNALFAGSSGTGKTMAAEVIGKELDLDIYKIDLSAVVSKYIGETEKNLNRLFTEAEHSNAILFFDEADALLGKRSEVKDAHDRFANIEIAYLLQKMEEYEGITILSTNLKKNIDEAFIRRIQFIVDFPFPDAFDRERIWQKTFPDETPIDADIDFPFLAKTFNLTGGNIRNIAIRAAYFAAQDTETIKMSHLVRATKRELQKMGKIYTEKDFGKYGKGQD